MGDLVSLEAFRHAKPASAFAAIDPTQDRLSEGIGSGYPVISYKGKVWYLKYKGESYTLVRPDDRTQLLALDIVILHAAPHKSKSFYAGWNEDNEGSRPLCASIDGVRPDNGVDQPQAQMCSLCPKNEFRVQTNGRKGKECSDYKRLAVLISPVITKAALGTPLLEPVFMRVPAASLQSLAKMGDDMAHQGWAYPTYFARAEFEMQESYPKIRFTPLMPVPEADAAFVEEMRTSPQTKRITEGEGFGMRQIAAPVTAPVTFSQPTVAAPNASAPGVAAPQTMDELAVMNALKARTVQEPAPQAPLPQPEAQPAPAPITMMGFSAAAAEAKPIEGEIIPPAKPAAAPATFTADAAADLGGPAMESTADLDAKIKNTMAKMGLTKKK